MLTDRVPDDRSSQPKIKPPWFKWKSIGFILPAVILLLGGGYRLSQSNAANRSAKFLTQPVERQTLPITISANGTMSAERAINLSPKTAGIVKTLLVKEGDLVTQGQVIASELGTA